ncbi:MAG: hypothetical protein QXY52_05040 [Conexivisphaerales archaeon]
MVDRKFNIKYDFISGNSSINWSFPEFANCPLCTADKDLIFSIFRKSGYIKLSREIGEDWSVAVIDHPSPIVDDSYEGEWNDWPLKSEPAKGRHYVIALGKDHIPFHELSKDTIMEGLYAAQEVYKKFSEINRVVYIIISLFSANGYDIKGHPHFDVIGLPYIPKIIGDQLNGFRQIYEDRNECPVCDIIKSEGNSNRIIYSNENWLVVIPWSPMKYNEIRILQATHYKQFQKLTQKEIESLAFMLKVVGASMGKLKGHDYSIAFNLPPPKRSTNYFHMYVSVYSTQTVEDALYNGYGILLTDPDNSVKDISRTFRGVLKDFVGL